MAELNNNQLILLDNLIYLNGVVEENGNKVSEVINNLLEEGGLKITY